MAGCRPCLQSQSPHHCRQMDRREEERVCSAGQTRLCFVGRCQTRRQTQTRPSRPSSRRQSRRQKSFAARTTRRTKSTTRHQTSMALALETHRCGRPSWVAQSQTTRQTRRRTLGQTRTAGQTPSTLHSSLHSVFQRMRCPQWTMQRGFLARRHSWKMNQRPSALTQRLLLLLLVRIHRQNRWKTGSGTG